MAEPGPQAAEETPKPSAFWKFWTTLPGVLTGLAALITAVVGFTAIFGGSDDDAGSAAAAPSPVTTPRVSDAASTSAGPASAPTTLGSTDDPGAASVIAEGRLELRVNEWANLTGTAVAASRTAGSEFALINAGSYALNPAIAQRFAVPADGGSDRDVCVRALQRRRDGPLPLQGLQEGGTVCLVTYAENIASLRITALPTVGSPRITFDYIVWA